MGFVTIFSLTEQHEAVDVGLRRLFERGDIEPFIQRLFGQPHCQRRQGGQNLLLILSPAGPIRTIWETYPDDSTPVLFALL